MVELASVMVEEAVPFAFAAGLGMTAPSQCDVIDHLAARAPQAAAGRGRQLRARAVRGRRTRCERIVAGLSDRHGARDESRTADGKRRASRAGALASPDDAERLFLERAHDEVARSGDRRRPAPGGHRAVPAPRRPAAGARAGRVTGTSLHACRARRPTSRSASGCSSAAGARDRTASDDAGHARLVVRPVQRVEQRVRPAVGVSGRLRSLAAAPSPRRRCRPTSTSSTPCPSWSTVAPATVHRGRRHDPLPACSRRCAPTGASTCNMTSVGHDCGVARPTHRRHDQRFGAAIADPTRSRCPTAQRVPPRRARRLGLVHRPPGVGARTSESPWSIFYDDRNSRPTR